MHDARKALVDALNRMHGELGDNRYTRDEKMGLRFAAAILAQAAESEGFEFTGEPGGPLEIGLAPDGAR